MSEETILQFSEDITNAEAPLPLPEGEYPAQIRGTSLEISNMGNQYVAVTFEISPSDYPADYPAEEAPDGTLLIYRRVMVEDSKRGRYRMRQFCETIDAPTGGNVDINEWIGLNAIVVVSNEEYEGEMRANVARVLRAD